MNIKRFIDRPILSIVISVTIVILGLIGLTMLPVEQYPEIAPPAITVSTSYTGANASTVQKSVIVPLEEAINGVEDMLYMTSSAANNGSASITIYFRQGTDADMAAVNVQNRVSSAQGLLPAEVTRAGVIVRKRQSSQVKIYALSSPDNSFDRNFIINYLRINIEPRIARISGVGDVMTMGADYALRIWLDPYTMSQYGLMPSDITAVLNEQNVEYPTGTLGSESENTFQYSLRYEGRYEDLVDFENIVVKSLPNGEVLYLKDVAKIELGSMNYDYNSNINGNEGVVSMVFQLSGSNANEVVIAINELFDEVKKDLPKGLELVDMFDTKQFLDASMDNVIITLIEAILLVILVVYVFLQSFRATIIPTIAILVSLVGTFAFIYIAGFSLNLLTLFALILVIGTVVDDAIVVVEAVQYKFDEGQKHPYIATVQAMKGITSALVTTTVVFMAVFIPVSFMSGTTGTFYNQFGITMAIAVGISTINALTLSPALCALLLTPHVEVKKGKKASFSSRFHAAFESAFTRIVQKYKAVVFIFLKRPWISVMLLLTFVGILYFLMGSTKTALVPNEDMGTIMVNVRTSTANTLKETEKVMDEVAAKLNQIEEIENYATVSGYSFIGAAGATNGMFIVRLKDWSERTEPWQSIDAVLGKIYGLTSTINTAQVLAFAPPMISGYGANSGFEIYVQDKKGGNIDELFGITQNFIQTLNARPEISRATTAFDTRFPQYMLEVDVAQCKRNGISATDVLSTISGYVGGNYVSNINKFSKLYRVMIQASPDDRLNIENLDNLYVRNSNGEMSPVTQYINLEKIYGPENLARFNLFPSIAVNGMPSEGYSSGQAIQAIEEVAQQTLPTGYGYEFGGMTREEADTGANETILVFAICIVFIYLILCALYESLLIPFAIILSVPFGLVGSFLFAKLFGTTNDIYMQTGLIMLIGLLAKTAILLTEYASERRREGMTIVQAAITAAQVRLRPILMTSMTMIFGMLPLMFASGVGANGNISLGVTLVGGMIVGTLALVFIVPAFFIIFQRIQERVMPNRVLPKIEE